MDLNRVYLDKCGFIIQFKPLVWKLVIGHIQYFLLRFIEEDGLNQNYNLAVLSFQRKVVVCLYAGNINLQLNLVFLEGVVRLDLLELIDHDVHSEFFKGQNKTEGLIEVVLGRIQIYVHESIRFIRVFLDDSSAVYLVNLCGADKVVKADVILCSN